MDIGDGYFIIDDNEWGPYPTSPCTLPEPECIINGIPEPGVSQAMISQVRFLLCIDVVLILGILTYFTVKHINNIKLKRQHKER